MINANGLPVSWRILTVNQIKADSRGSIAIGPFGSRMKSELYTASGVPVIRGQNISDTRQLDGDFVFVEDNTADNLRSCLVYPDDLVFPHRGSIGEVAIVPHDHYDRYVMSTSLMKLTCDKTVADPVYVFYFFRSQVGRRALLEHASTVGTPGIGQPLRSLKSIQIPVPPVREQQGIATILGALDSKIAVNEQLLERSDELVRSWYAEYSAKTTTTIAIDQLGSQVRNTISAGSISGQENYIGLEHMPRRRMWLPHWEPSHSVVSMKSEFQRGDILFGKLRPYFHKVGIALTDGVASTDILVVRPRSESYRGWLLAALSSNEVVAHASAVGDGTRMPRARWSDLAGHQIPWPGPDRADPFNGFVAALVSRIGAACAENRVLAELRDFLLPRLVTGEIRVRDAEELVEGAT